MSALPPDNLDLSGGSVRDLTSQMRLPDAAACTATEAINRAVGLLNSAHRRRGTDQGIKSHVMAYTLVLAETPDDLLRKDTSS